MDQKELLQRMPGIAYQLVRDPNGKFRFSFIDSGVERLLGFTVSDLLEDASALLHCIHPDDYSAVFSTSITAAEEGRDWHHPFRFIHPDGEVLWLDAHERGEQQNDGSLVWSGFLFEANERKRLECQLVASEYRFRTLVEQAHDIIFTVDANGIITYLSPNWKQHTGYDIDDSINQSFETIVHADDVALCNAFIQSVITTGPEVDDIEFRVLHDDGKWRWFTCRASSIDDPHSERPQLLGIAREITEQRQQREKIARMARQDMLTNLSNRAHFEEVFERHLAHAAKHEQPLAILFIDLDEFKPVNDTHGHSVGDQLLVHVARRIKSCLRDTDAACRSGGDEFLVLANELADTESAEQVAVTIAERIRTELAKPFTIEQAHISISASIGIAVFPTHALLLRDILRCADRAMYRAKLAGRNRVCVADCRAGTPCLR